jgi:cytochrome c oxidase cbb3-type subunit IV
MDITFLRIVATLASFAAFIGIVGWAWSRQRAQDFEAAGRLPFEQD